MGQGSSRPAEGDDCSSPCKPKDYKITVIGSKGVGKTSIVSRLLDLGTVPAEGDASIDDICRKSIVHPSSGESYTLEILDVDFINSSNMSPTVSSFVKSSDGFVVVYSLVDHGSYDQADSIVDVILTDRKASKIPVLFIGNKCEKLHADEHDQEQDTPVDNNDDEAKRTKHAPGGQKLAERSQADWRYVECSTIMTAAEGSSNNAWWDATSRAWLDLLHAIDIMPEDEKPRPPTANHGPQKAKK
eukprot:TRINITY_DN10867_c0_g1_i3.p1 TRINITY_DN10867_c0_g1~~TRINITY_DN10867_c0_g1_i3.p1  ORF type:complete len:244 (-),score=45.25 TRINITY_DN10867_c0_g1_i3:11-742(-)